MRHHSDLEGLLDTDRERGGPSQLKYMLLENSSLGGFFFFFLKSSRHSSQIQGYALSLPLNSATENHLGGMEKVEDKQKKKKGNN